jgi:hypothetical protein
MKKITSERFLTISAQFTKNSWTKSINPKLTLSGKWMENAGFKIGEKVLIVIENDILIIRKIENE